MHINICYKMFCSQVKDIHSVLEVTVYDEDRNKKVEFLGKIAIPLMKVSASSYSLWNFIILQF